MVLNKTNKDKKTRNVTTTCIVVLIHPFPNNQPRASLTFIQHLTFSTTIILCYPARYPDKPGKLWSLDKKGITNVVKLSIIKCGARHHHLWHSVPQLDNNKFQTTTPGDKTKKTFDSLSSRTNKCSRRHFCNCRRYYHRSDSCRHCCHFSNELERLEKRSRVGNL